jgi:hypothetical protein
MGSLPAQVYRPVYHYVTTAEYANPSAPLIHGQRMPGVKPEGVKPLDDHRNILGRHGPRHVPSRIEVPIASVTETVQHVHGQPGGAVHDEGVGLHHTAGQPEAEPPHRRLQRPAHAHEQGGVVVHLERPATLVLRPVLGEGLGFI